MPRLTPAEEDRIIKPLTVGELAFMLSQLPQDAPITLRDVNGLDWTAEARHVLLHDGEVIICTEGINEV